MKKAGLTLVLLLIISIGFTGCITNNIYNVQKDIKGSNNTLISIEKNIMKAGKSLGWDMQVQREGEIIGILILRSHMARINIKYNEESYKINYLKSSNLQYDAKTNTIHRNYNGWITNLENTINNYLDDLKMDDTLIKKSEQVTKDKLSSDSVNEGTKIIDINEKITKILTKEEISDSIISAGESLGWKMQLQEQGFILAKIALRTHSATIKIKYNESLYKINYLTSTNLNYSNNYTIHRNYNGWITNLKNAIDARINSK